MDKLTDFQGLMTLTLTLVRVILHTVMHQSSTSTYIPNFIEIEETFCGRTDVHFYVRVFMYVFTDGRTFDTGFIRSTPLSRPKNREIPPLLSSPPTRPARRQRYRPRQTTTTDASEQNNTGPLGGPVISYRYVTHRRKQRIGD